MKIDRDHNGFVVTLKQLNNSFNFCADVLVKTLKVAGLPTDMNKPVANSQDVLDFLDVRPEDIDRFFSDKHDLRAKWSLNQLLDNEDVGTLVHFLVDGRDPRLDDVRIHITPTVIQTVHKKYFKARGSRYVTNDLLTGITSATSYRVSIQELTQHIGVPIRPDDLNRGLCAIENYFVTLPENRFYNALFQILLFVLKKEHPHEKNRNHDR